MSGTAHQTPFSVFLASFVVIFVMTLSAADSVGFVPYYIDGTDPSASRSALPLSQLPELGEQVAAVEDSILPTRLRIPAIDLDLPISNPSTRNLEALDVVLKNGPARYVDSAKLGEKGNVLIFGHSSHLPIVHNQMYKAFNKIPDLKTGDSITIEGDGKAFEYIVKSVEKVDADAGIVDLSKEGNKLTIVTCDTLTGKSSRFVLEADLVGLYRL